MFNYRIAQGRGKYCSVKCFWEARKGVHVAPDTEFKPGHLVGKRFIKGVRSSPETEFKKGEKHGIQWEKGCSIGGIGTKFKEYHQLHHWIRNTLGKPLTCWYCKTIEAKKYHWANKSGFYKKEVSDWIRLCAKCHYDYDRIPEKRADIRAFLEKLQ